MLIRAGLKPQVNFNSTNMYSPVINGYGYDEIITNGGNYNALLGVNYTVVGKNNLDNQYSSLSIQKQILELKTKLSERDLKQTVTAQYITVYGQQQLLVNTEKVFSVLKNEDLILKNISEKGQYRHTDYLSFLVSYKQQQLSYSQQKLQAQNDLYVLNYLCGIMDTTYVILPDPALSASPVFNSDQTIQFRQFVLDSLKLQNSIEQIKFNYKPKLSLLGDAGYNTTFTYHAEKNFGASVGLNFSVPIYDGKQRKLQMKKFILSENTRMSYADYYRKQYSMKQMQLQQQISETEKLVTEAQEQLKISETLLKANSKLLETGDIRITDYVISVTTYFSSQSTVQQLITSKMQLINQYNFLNY
jgi:outer membrane protein TolC